MPWRDSFYLPWIDNAPTNLPIVVSLGSLFSVVFLPLFVLALVARLLGPALLILFACIIYYKVMQETWWAARVEERIRSNRDRLSSQYFVETSQS
jgi:hypothetical protein